MKFLTARREREIVAYIQDAKIEHALDVQLRDDIIIALEEHKASLESALKDAIRLQRMILETLIDFRDDPDGEIDFDPDEMLTALGDQIAMLEEHT